MLIFWFSCSSAASEEETNNQSNKGYKSPRLVRRQTNSTTISQGYGDDLPLWTYLDEIWYPSIRALNTETARTAALYSYVAAIKSGTTTVNDMYRFVGSLADAAAKIGIRAVLSNDVALPEYKLDSVMDNEVS